MELKERIKCKPSPDVIAVSEVKPKNYQRDISAVEYKLKGYQFEHTDIENRDTSRGMGIYIKDTLNYSLVNPQTMVNNVNDTPKELLCIEIPLHGNEKMLFCNIYRNPKADEKENKNINIFIKRLVNLKYKHKIVCGDFNRKDINWKTISSPSEDDMKFLEACQDSFLTQHIDKPTRGRGSDKPSLIDLFLTSHEDSIEDITLDSPLGKSDHSLIKVNYRTQRKFSTAKFVLNYSKADFEKMRTMLDIDWKNLLKRFDKDIDGMWKVFLEKYTEALENCVPKKEVKCDARNPQSRIDRKGLIKRKQKQRLWNRYLGSKSPLDYLNYCMCRNQVSQLTRKRKKEHEKMVAKCIKSNSKLFWKYVNEQTKLKEAVPHLYKNKKQDVNFMTTCDSEKAEVLGRYFSDVFVKEPDWSWDLPVVKDLGYQLEINITKELIEEKLSELKINKSPDLDSIHPRVLKELSSVISEPLLTIYNQSLKYGKLPSEWKRAPVTPIYKGKGSKHACNNYRPISITSILCRILESIIRDSLMRYMTANCILSDKQFGFISGRSTVLQLLHVFDKWTEILDRGEEIDVIFCDFQKAFDTVPHKRLCDVLAHYGITDPLLSWIKDFLTERKFKVRVSDCTSNWFDIASGVPQGSVLGPVLFIIYINTIIQSANCSNMYLYADDLKIFKEITSEEDTEALQLLLDKMYDWTRYSLLQFHPSKCNTMRLTTPRNNKNCAEGYYNMDETRLKTVEVEKDLGIYIDKNLGFDEHINLKVKKSNGLVGMIKRSFTFINKAIFKQLFTTIVRPHLEYGAPIWNPHLKRQINLIESVQRRATKLVPGLKDLPYKERLKILELPTLEYRRYRGDMIETYKLMHGFYGSYKNLLNERANERSENASMAHNFSLWKESKTKDIRTYFFKNRVTEQWNNLPKHVVCSSSINLFKERLDKIWRVDDVMYDNQINLYERTSSRRTRYIKT